MGFFNRTLEEKTAKAEKSLREKASLDEFKSNLRKYKEDHGLATPTGATLLKTFKGNDGKIELFDSLIIAKGQKADLRTEAVTATFDMTGEVVRRFTATRLIALGPLGLAFKKGKDKRQAFLVLEGEKGFAFLTKVDPNKEKEAREFALKVNAQSRKSLAS